MVDRTTVVLAKILNPNLTSSNCLKCGSTSGCDCSGSSDTKHDYECHRCMVDRVSRFNKPKALPLDVAQDCYLIKFNLHSDVSTICCRRLAGRELNVSLHIENKGICITNFCSICSCSYCDIMSVKYVSLLSEEVKIFKSSCIHLGSIEVYVKCSYS